MGDIFDDIFGAPQRARPTFNQKDKEHLYASQKGKCNGCGTKFPLRNLTIDHIKPFSKGGSDKPSNLQLLCGSCNSAKGNGTAIIPPGPPRLGPDPKWDRRNALKVICRLVLEEAHQAHRPDEQ